MIRSSVCVAVLTAAVLGACQSPTEAEARPFTRPETPPPGESIVIGGTKVRIGAPVVLWTDLEGHDGYRNGLADRGFGESRGDSVEELAERVDQLVLHYDACGTSETCFDVLRRRGLSVHFLLDLDGTLYQTLDVKETAWHATVANGRSVGVEIASIGAYPPGRATLDEWYPSDAGGPWIRLPSSYADGGLRTPDFIGRPARPERIQGTVNGVVLEQYDFTAEQYATLVKLAAGLCRTLPRIAPDAPRGADGAVRTDALSPEALAGFRGILGHGHVQSGKADPGPAFRWERFLVDVRAELDRERAAP